VTPRAISQMIFTALVDLDGVVPAGKWYSIATPASHGISSSLSTRSMYCKEFIHDLTSDSLVCLRVAVRKASNMIPPMSLVMTSS
jgi:hypothetical protein